MQARTLIFMLILSLVMGSVASTQPALGVTEDISPTERVQQGLRTIAAAEFAYFAKTGGYARIENLAENEYLSEDLLNWHKNGKVSYDSAVPYLGDERKPQQFVAVAHMYINSTKEHISFRVDETGVVQAADWTRSARWYLDVLPFFSGACDWAQKSDGVTKVGLFNVQLALERWSVDHSPKDGPDIYPLSLDTLIVEKYIQAGYYPNPLLSLNYDQLTATEVALGVWAPGDFTYLPYIPDPAKDNQPKGYMLVGYSVYTYGGIDGTGVAIILTSGSCPSEWCDKTIRSLFDALIRAHEKQNEAPPLTLEQEIVKILPGFRQ